MEKWKSGKLEKWKIGKLTLTLTPRWLIFRKWKIVKLEKWKSDFFYFLKTGKVKNCKVKEWFYFVENWKSVKLEKCRREHVGWTDGLTDGQMDGLLSSRLSVRTSVPMSVRPSVQRALWALPITSRQYWSFTHFWGWGFWKVWTRTLPSWVYLTTMSHCLFYVMYIKWLPDF